MGGLFSSICMCILALLGCVLSVEARLSKDAISPLDHPDRIPDFLEHLVSILDRLTSLDDKFDNFDRRLTSLEQLVNDHASDLKGKVDVLDRSAVIMQDLRAVCAELSDDDKSSVSTESSAVTAVPRKATGHTEPVDTDTEQTTYEESTLPAMTLTTTNSNHIHCRPAPENIIPFCKVQGIPDMVHIPGFMGIHDFEEANMELNQFYPLVKIQCSPHLAKFLCSAYFPKCDPETSDPIGPCRDLCEEATSGCEPLMNEFGFAWPQSLNCSRFSASEGDNCLNALTALPSEATEQTEPVDIDTEPTTSGESIQSTIPLTTTNYHCQPVPPNISPLCKDHVPDLVHVPGFFGFHNFDDAGLELHQFFPLVKVQCSPHLAKFLCSAYFPKCDPDSSDPIGPCRDLCEEARAGCEPLMNKFGFAWPDSLNCSHFSISENGHCLYALTPKLTQAIPTEAMDVHTERPIQEESTQRLTTSVSTSDNKYCRPAPTRSPVCENHLPHQVHVPGFLGIDNVEDSASAVQQFHPLIQAGCSPHLTQFVCSVFFPECDPEFADPIGPCRNLCEEARAGCSPLLNNHGISWPSSFNCSRFIIAGIGRCFGV